MFSGKNAKTIVFVAILGFLSLNIFGQDISLANSLKFKVKYSDNTEKTLDQFQSTSNKFSKSGIVLTGISSVDELNKGYQIISMTRVFPDGGKFEARHRKHGLHLWYELEIRESSKVNIKECIKAYNKDKNINICEPYYKKELINQGIASVITDTLNDPRLAEQWHYNNDGQTGGAVGSDISLFEAWQIESGSDEVIVAVIDGGVDYNHSDLSGAMWTNSAELNGTAGVDDDGNGYIDDIHGYGFGDNIGEYNPGDHGTHVGGTIGAVNNNGIGVAGIAGGNGASAGVQLMSCAVFGSNDNDGFDVAFVYAADNGAVISQNSWGYVSVGYYEQSVLDAIDYFITNAGYRADGSPFGPMQGGLVIFAAGNDSDDGQYYPGYYDPILTVSATNHNDQKSWYSNYGDWVDIAAPGGETSISYQGVLSTLPNNNYGFYQGTSMACPHVSGVAALVVSKHGGNGLTSEMVKHRLLNSVDNIDSNNPSYIGKLGAGRLNAYHALLDDDGVAPNPISDVAIIDTSMTSITLQWTATGFSADSGAATTYDIRFADFEITPANFNTAPRVQNAPTPSIAGTAQMHEIEGLSAQTTYWFAIKASDYFGNTSTVSNIINVTTKDAPIISVNPEFIVHSMDSGMQNVITAEILNIGAVDLEFSIPLFSQVSNKLVNKTNHIDFDFIPEKGEVDIREGHPVITGEGNDGETGFGYSWKDNKDGDGPAFNWIDISSYGTALTSYGDDNYQLVPLSIDFPFYEEIKNQVYISTNGLLSFNSSGASSLSNRQLPYYSTPNDIIAVLWDDLYASSGVIQYYGDSDKFIVQYNNIHTLGGSYYYTMQAILYANGNIVLQYLNVDPSTSSSIGIENSLGNDGLQIAFNTSYIQDSLAIVISQNPDFIKSVTPFSGIITAGSSQSIDITLNSDDLSPDNYEGEIEINSNDPLNPIITLPVQLHVNGDPFIYVQADSLNYDTVFVNATDSLPVIVQNTGTDSLIVSNMYIENSLFELEAGFSEFKLYNGDEKQFYVYFTPSSEINYTDTLILVNNTTTSNIKIALMGVGVNPPIFTVRPKDFTFDALVGDTILDSFSVGNINGGYTLYYEVSDVIYGNSLEANQQVYSLPGQTIVLSDNDNYKADSVIKTISEIVATSLEDLTGKNIGMYGVYSSLIMSDLVSRGANVYNLYSPLSSTILDTIDVFVVDDDVASISANELHIIRDFIINGGSLFSEGDDTGSMSNIDSLIIGSGIELFNYESFSNLLILDFISHPINQGVDSIYSSSTGLYFTANSPATNIVFTDNSEGHVAVSKIGKGRILVAGNEISRNSFTSYSDDNRTFVNNAFDWLCNNSNGWLSISQDVDTLIIGDSYNIPFQINTGDLLGGEHIANVILESNDPINPKDTVTVTLNLMGVAEIAANLDSLNYDSVFVNTTDSLPITINNDGTDSLIVSNLYIQDGLFDLEAGFSDFKIYVGEQIQFYVYFNPTTDLTYIDTLVLVNNSLQGDLRIPLYGIGLYPPVFASSPESIGLVLNVGDSLSTPITINNTAGASDLIYNISINDTKSLNKINPKIGFYADESRVALTTLSLPDFTGSISQNNLGDYINEYSNFPISNTGVVVIGDYAYVVDYDSAILHKFSLTNDSIVNSYSIHSSPFGIAYDGSYLWIGNGSGNVYGYDFSGALMGSFSCPVSGYNALTFNGQSFVTCYYDSNNPTFTEVDYDNTVLSSIPSNIGGIHQITKSYDYLYAIGGNTNNLITLDTLNNEVIIIDTIPFYSATDYNIYSLYSSNNKIWVSNWYGPLYEIKGELKDWLDLASYSGTLIAGESINIDAIINTKELIAGVYNKTISITSNDPNHSGTSIPVHIELHGLPSMELSVDSLNFDTCYVGFQKTKSLSVLNSGTDTLKITDIVSSNTDFVVDTTQLILLPNQSHNLNLSYQPIIDEADIAQLSIISNDSSQLSSIVNLVGFGVNPPVLDIQQDSIVVDLYSGDSVISLLNFDNSIGGDALQVNLKIKYLSNDTLNSNLLTTDQIPLSKITLSATKGIDSILVIQDYSSWSKFSMADVLINNFGIHPYVIQSYSLSQTDLSDFQLIYICSAQGTSYYNNINQNNTLLESYVQNGGKIVYQTATHGSDVNLPGGYSLTYGNHDFYNDNIMPEHRLMQNVDTVVYGYYANFNYLESYPNDSEVLTTLNNEITPTTIVYEYGQGKVVATGMTWEFYYDLDTNYYNMVLNTVNYMLNQSGTNGWVYTPKINYLFAANSSGEIPVTINAKGLSQGVYNANVEIVSNDPLNTNRTIPVKLNVTNAANISLSEDTIYFENAYVNNLISDSIVISNNGTDTLRITSIDVLNNEVFTASCQEVNIAPGKSTVLNISVSMVESISLETLVTISSNAISNSLVSLKIITNGKNAPVLNLISNNLTAYVMPDETTSKEFVLSNSGGSELTYNLQSETTKNIDTTSTIQFFSTGEDTEHLFSGLSTIEEFKLIVTLNGDYTYYSYEYADLEIEGMNIGQINTENITDGVDYIKEYNFAGDTVMQWLTDGNLQVFVRNSSGVNTGYGSDIHQVQLIAKGEGWFKLKDTTGVLAPNDTIKLLAEFNADQLIEGDYSTSFSIITNEPASSEVEVPVLLKVRGESPPIVYNPISDRMHYLTEKEIEIDISDVFLDVNNDQLLYSVTSSNIENVFASIKENNILNLRMFSSGASQITLGARDNYFDPVYTSFNILVIDNSAPEIVIHINDTILNINDAPLMFNLTNIFSDADNDVLTYLLTNSNTEFVNGVINDAQLELYPVRVGNSTINVIASDNKGSDTELSFNVAVVSNSAPIIIKPIVDTLIYTSNDELQIDLTEVFDDEDELIYSFETNNLTIGTELIGTKLIISNEVAGTATISVWASDSYQKVIDTFNVIVEKNVGISTLDLTQTINVYPVPFKETISVECDLIAKGNIGINIYSISGKVIEYFDLGVQPIGKFVQVLNLGKLSKGIYYLAIRQDESISEVKKIIKD